MEKFKFDFWSDKGWNRELDFEITLTVVAAAKGTVVNQAFNLWHYFDSPFKIYFRI